MVNGRQGQVPLPHALHEGRVWKFIALLGESKPGTYTTEHLPLTSTVLPGNGARFSSAGLGLGHDLAGQYLKS